MSIGMIKQSAASVPTPPAGEENLFFDSADDKLKKKISDGSVVDIEGGGGGVTSFNGRAGAVVPAANDYGAIQITNVPFGSVVNTNVQDAINYLENSKVSTALLGAPNGIATLDSGGKIPLGQIPASLVGAVSYQSTWNANLNSPPLSSGVGTKGYYYVVNVAGSTNLDGITSWQVGDWAIFNGVSWEQVDNTNYNTRQTNILYVDKLGNDSTGTGSLEAPYLTVSAAMASISAPSSANRYIIMLDPGTYTEASLTLKPWVWVQGKANLIGGATRISITSGAITLDPSWSAGSQRGGFSNIYLTGTTGLNFDRQAISGLGSVTIELVNVGMNGSLIYKASNGTLDFVDVRDSRIFGAVQISGGSINLNGAELQSTLTLDTAGAQNLEAEIINSTIIGAAAFNSTGSNTSVVRLKSTQITGGITKSGSGTSVSYPLGAYAPTTPANWVSQPASVDQALDNLASQAMIGLSGEVTAGPGGGTQPATLSNAAVIAKVLTGLTESYGLALSTDSILQAIAKLVWTQALQCKDINVDLVIPANYTLIRAFTRLKGSSTLTIGAGATLKII